MTSSIIKRFGSRTIKLITIFSFLLFAATISPYLPAPGINSPSAIEPYLGGVFSTTAPGGGTGNWEVEVVYPNLTFTDPLSMLELPDQSGFYIAGKPGYIWKISNDNNTNQKTTVLDFSDVVDTDGDSGMMNAILHPEFGQPGSPNRGYMYVLYRYHPNGNLPGCGDDAMIRLSRFNKPDGSESFDRNSEYVHIQIFDTHCWHNGGGMFFDNDGYMFITIGDAGGANDQFNTAQQIDQTLLGGLLRIDLTGNQQRSHPIRRQPIDPASKPASLPNSFTQGYLIPNDNPWLDTGGGILEEFYSLGLRSPHRATYDEQTGDIWIGDVGQGAREEISVAVKGGNFQWPYKEGSINGPKAKPSPLIGTDQPPIFDYGRSVGNAVIGGFVYRGSKFASSLGGKYIFGDHGVRNIWTLNPNNGEVVFVANIPAFGVGSKSGISSFHTDSNGEVYILKLYGTDQDGGKIYRLKQDVSVPDPPQFLSQTGAFSNLSNLNPRSGLVPYTVNTPLWSDGASKKRWIAVPNDGSHNTNAEQITFSENGEWQFPPGTVFVKHFELPINEGNPSITARVETRFIVIAEDGGAYGVTYKWNDAGTDAELLTSGDSKTFTITRANGSQYSQVWDYPSRTDCNTCHNANANFVLGVKTRQLNGNMTYPSGTTDNQLNTWQSLGMFSNGFTSGQISGFPKMVPLGDNTANLETKVRSYLDANCAHCHRPNGVEGAFDARFSTPLSSQNLINTIGISHNTANGSVIVKPKDPGNSELWVRDNSLGNNAMPPLAKSIIDDEYIDVLTDWINSLDETACTATYLSDLSWEGTPTNGWGPVELDQSNGGTGSNDGSTLTINGVTYAKGLGAHAVSEIIYNIAGNYETFKAFIGVDDSTCGSGSVQFEVYTDGSLAYQSSVLTQSDNAVPISVDVTDVNTLRLVVNDGGSGGSNPIACDHANWADAKLESCVTTNCDDLGIFATTEDIGGVQAAGQACHDNGFYTLTGSGADIWGNNDEFHYTYTSHTGDLEIIAKVNTVDNTNQWAKAGPMIRASNNSNSAMAIVLQRPDNQVGFQWRASNGASATWTGSLVGGTGATKFLRLTRNGNVFNAYYSTSTSNGPWTQIGGDVNIPMNAQALVGLAVTSHSDGNLCTATFEEVRLETCTLEPGSSCNDNDPCTINDVYDNDCNCAGTFQDSDQDGVCDQDDICPGSDDTLDADNDGIPDGCDTCDGNLEGTSCDDSDPCTINDVYDADCNCAGTFQDSDQDGVCDQDDICPGFNDNTDTDADGTPDGCDTCDGNLEGTSCDDNDPCTINDVYDADCNCAGTFQDSDQDGICDQDDICPGSDDTLDADNDGTPDGCDTCDGNLEGTSCDDNDPCTINDVYDADCNCAGTFQDSDNDGTCDQDDLCPGSDDTLDADNDGTPDGCDTCDGNLAGTSCDDNDPCTTNDVFDADCNCAGTFQDSDQDGVCDQDDICPGFDDQMDGDGDGTPDGCDTCDGSLTGTSCDDSDPCTINDVYDADCNCAGTFQDSDQDGVCDQDDLCPGSDDTLDADNDGTPDGCDTCDGNLAGTSCDDNDPCTTNDVFDANCNCAGTFQDTDQDGVCDQDDICPGFDDNTDTDADGTPDGCDNCNGNLVGTSCDDSDPCTVNDIYDADCNCAGTYQDADQDGYCVADDPDDTDACNPDASGVDCSPCTVITFDNFDSGWGNWNDGGSDCSRSSVNAYSGGFNARIRDNAGLGSSFFTDNLDLSTYESVEVTFTYITNSMDNITEDFWLQISTNGGASYSTYEEWNLGDEFENNVRYFETVNISNITFSSNTRFRFICDASSNGDQVYIDDVQIKACTDSGSCTPGTSCDDGLACTINDVFDADCNCAGTFQDSDNDGVCDQDDVCPGSDDNADADNDGTPDGCDSCDGNLAGTSCDDNDPCTINDIFDANCNCAGTFQDSDNDGVCDQDDICPGHDDTIDSDNDGTPDGCEDCDGSLAGTPCDDNDPCTINDLYDANCNCAGTFQDADQDGVCIGEDPNDNDPCTPNASGVDCGDPCTVIDFSNFDSGWGIWNDGGSDCTRSTTNAYSGAYSARIRDNSGISSSFYTDDLNLSAYSSLEITFTYITSSMDNSNEDFWLEVSTNGGSSYTLVEEWNLGDEFVNNQRYFDKVVINGIVFSGNTKLRFRCDASANGDLVYIDDVEIKACSGVSNCTPGTACDDGIACTINDAYDSDCNCVGVQTDADQDGICDQEDQCPGFNDNLIGTACDDNDPCTVNDIYTTDCGCAGTYQDADQDGLCVGEDPDDNDPCNPDDSAGNCGTGCVTIDSEDFENGWGIWLDGGSDCRRSINDQAYANSGSYCVRLRDNSGIFSSMYTQALDLSTYTSVEFSFSYFPNSMDQVTEDFWLQVSTNNGSTYSTYEEWNLNDEFVNGQRYNETVNITGINFTSETRFRIVCDASSNGDYVYIDDVVIKGCSDNQALATNGENKLPAPQSAGETKPYLELATTLQVEVRPNPFEDELKLYIDRPSPSMKRAILRITDVNGRIIHQRFDAPFDEEFIIPTHEGWSPGIYFVIVQASHLTQTLRIVKQ